MPNAFCGWACFGFSLNPNVPACVFHWHEFKELVLTLSSLIMLSCPKWAPILGDVWTSVAQDTLLFFCHCIYFSMPNTFSGWARFRFSLNPKLSLCSFYWNVTWFHRAGFEFCQVWLCFECHNWCSISRIFFFFLGAWGGVGWGWLTRCARICLCFFNLAKNLVYWL